MNAIYNANAVFKAVEAGDDAAIGAAKFPQLGSALRGFHKDIIAERIRETMISGHQMSNVLAKMTTESKRDALARAHEDPRVIRCRCR